MQREAFPESPQNEEKMHSNNSKSTTSQQSTQQNASHEQYHHSKQAKQTPKPISQQPKTIFKNAQHDYHPKHAKNQLFKYQKELVQTIITTPLIQMQEDHSPIAVALNAAKYDHGAAVCAQHALG